jgi:hypothetical protein
MTHTALRYQCSPYHIVSALYSVIERFQRAAGFIGEDSPGQLKEKSMSEEAKKPTIVIDTSLDNPRVHAP